MVDLELCWAKIFIKTTNLVEGPNGLESLKPVQKDVDRGFILYSHLKMSTERDESWDAVAERMGEAGLDLMEQLIRHFLIMDQELRANETDKTTLNLELLGKLELVKLGLELRHLCIKKDQDATEGI